jgi:predicted unusual protein kinase regulating ubiquinone biosynthesis (AarF/ABC1/UbiB family)
MVSARGTTIRRAARLMNMGAGLAGSYIGYQLQRHFLDKEKAGEKKQLLKGRAAKRIRSELQEMKGPIMKIGQMLSMQTAFLEPEFIAELSALQMQAPPMHPSLMRAQFKSSIGCYPEEVFRAFDEQPFAAASLGQVHHAVAKDGEPVAVKIQYPAMREAIEGDFNALRAAGLLARVSGHLKESVVNETERGILEETDYAREARNIEFFREALAPLKFIRLPEVRRDLSSDRVLTMSRVPGLRMPQFLATSPSQKIRNRIGDHLNHLFFFQLFRVQALHADPHPGNYLLNSDGTIGLIDFGCVKHLKPQVIKCYAQFWSREWVHDEQLFAEIIHTLFGPKVSPKDANVRRCMSEIRRFYDLYHPLSPSPEGFHVSDEFMLELGKLARVLLKNKFISADFVFLSRTESGMCNLLHMLKARVATTAIVRQWMPQSLARAGAGATPLAAAS